ncbi:MAG: serine/threonine-protein phosphatase [Deltaproteobacteria bacterium]|nr:serine/threonine-protein phosphatase [Deltaproteobacteria bacterium]MBI2341370.1 serine/threonine-protein phosphatase [Deltaproteobacteria bacterium]MBI2974784.1 serine/threonine-protein phosphatase [Deltaproteobacteria bacterium]
MQPLAKKPKIVESKGEFLNLRACAATDIGKRNNNEDSFLMNENIGLYMVADGMGGGDMGEFASWFATRKVEEIMSLKHGVDEFSFDSNILRTADNLTDEAHMRYAVWSANVNLRAEAIKRELTKTGTTLAAIFFKGNKAYIANIGDSRCYRISYGKLDLVTHDHSIVARRLRTGDITRRGFKRAKGRNLITRTIGADESAEADSYVLTVYPREKFLLCTDGLYNVVDEKTILKYTDKFDIEPACEKLVTLARDSGGRDNITAVLVEVANVGKTEASTVSSDRKNISGPDDDTIT